MSADLSDPAIAEACQKLSSKSDPTSWLLLRYSIPSTPSPIVFLSSGPDPVIGSWQTTLAASDDEVIFGYGEVGGKVLVLLYLTERVGGVRRARAVVHSRAVAQLVPDYSALITISRPSELTEELVKEKLGIDVLAQVQTPAVISLNDDTPPRPPRRLNSDASGDTPPHSATSTTSSFVRELSTSTPREVPPVEPVAEHPLPKIPVEAIAELPLGLTDTLKQSSPGPTTIDILTPHAPAQVEVASALPISATAATEGAVDRGSLVAEHDADRSRQVFLASRLKGTLPSITSDFGGNPSPTLPNTPSTRVASETTPRSPIVGDASQAPESPSGKSKFSRFFSRRKSSNTGGTPPGSVPTSPMATGHERQSSDAPPVPPKDTFPRQPEGKGRFGTTEKGSHAANGNGHVEGNDLGSVIRSGPSPSASANTAFADAREKQVAQELDMHDRFRRDQVEKERIRRHSGDRNAVVLPMKLMSSDDEDDIGLPYDREEPEVDNRVRAESGGIASAELPRDEAMPLGSAAAEAQLPDSAVTHESNGTFSQNPVERLSAVADEHAERVKAAGGEEDASVEGKKAIDDETLKQFAAEAASQEARIAQDVGEHRAEELQADLVRAEAERLEAERIEAERALAEAQRVEAERIEAERLKRERIVAETERRRSEEGRAIQAEEMRLAQVRAKETVTARLREGKSDGGVMLQGWVTVQTLRSPTWRRRFFHLHPTEMRLYKAEGNSKPIQTIQLGPGSSVSQEYEESQVQGSFRISSQSKDGEEIFFLFADSNDDKDTILEGLAIAMQ